MTRLFYVFLVLLCANANLFSQRNSGTIFNVDGSEIKFTNIIGIVSESLEYVPRLSYDKTGIKFSDKDTSYVINFRSIKTIEILGGGVEPIKIVKPRLRIRLKNKKEIIFRANYSIKYLNVFLYDNEGVIGNYKRIQQKKFYFSDSYNYLIKKIVFN